MTERYTEETWSQYSARLEQQRRAQQQRAEEAEALVAALVRKYGEPVHGNGYRLALTDAELEDTPGVLSFNLDPCSGAVLVRFRPE